MPKDDSSDMAVLAQAFAALGLTVSRIAPRKKVDQVLQYVLDNNLATESLSQSQRFQIWHLCQKTLDYSYTPPEE